MRRRARRRSDPVLGARRRGRDLELPALPGLQLRLQHPAGGLRGQPAAGPGTSVRMPEYDERTALVVVDVQNDFADPKGSLTVAGAENVLPLVNEQIAQARTAGALVVFSQDWHPEST